MSDAGFGNTDPESYASAIEIKTPLLYRCNVYRYSSSLSSLYIRVFKGMSKAPSFYLFFSDVGYFEGAMNWRSADVRVAPSEDSLVFLKEAGLVEEIMLDDPDTRLALAEAAKLYVFITPLRPIRLIAGSITKLNEMPPEEESEV